MTFPEYGRILEEGPKAQEFPEFGRVLEEEETKPSTLQEIMRHSARTGARIGETIAGLPGDIFAIPGKIATYAAEKISGKEQPGIRKAVELARTTTPFGQLPTSSEIREITKAFSANYLEPKNETEALADDVISDAVALMIPIKGKVPFLKSIALSAGSNLVGKATEKFSGKSDVGTYAKLGSLMLMSMASKSGFKGADKFVNGLYSQAEATIPEAATVNATKMSENLSRLKKSVSLGTKAPSEKFIINEVDEILEKVKDGKISPQEAMASKRSLNEKIASFAYGPEPQQVKARAKKLAPIIKKELNSVINEYGKENPEFLKTYRQAEEGFATIAQSKRVSNFIQKHAQMGKIGGGGALALEALTGHPGMILPTISAAAGSYSVIKSAELMTRIAKSPTLRKYYLGVINAAAQENAIDMNKNLQKLDIKLQKEFPFEFEIKD